MPAQTFAAIDATPDPTAPDPTALARAERARVNGARSNGPVTAMGKARSSRNALKHGLRARLVVPEEDEAAFRGMAGRLFAEIAPAGELEGFLVADLAAAMWRTGRAQRLEAAALAGDEADEAKLGLALRYHGSASRELFRALRALQGLRRTPLTLERPAAVLADGRAGANDDAISAAAEPDTGVPEVAELAWGGGAALPPPPAGCLMLRPVPYHDPRDWYRSQNHAFPAAARVPVDARGTVFALEGERWIPRAWPADPVPTAPPTTAQRPNEPSQATDPAGKPPHATPVADPPLTPRHGLSWADLGPQEGAADLGDDPLRPIEPVAPGPGGGPGSFARFWGLAPPLTSAARAPGGG